MRLRVSLALLTAYFSRLTVSQLYYKPLKDLGVSKERGFTRPGYSQSDSVMQRRAAAIEALLTEALAVHSQKPTPAAASEALMLLWCATASAVRHKQKAKSDELILQRIDYWSSVGSAAAATAGADAGSGTPVYMSPPRGTSGGLVSAGTSEVATAFFDVSPKRTPQQPPASPGPGAASPWDPFKGSTPVKSSHPPAMQLEGGCDDAEEGGPDTASSAGGSPEQEGDAMWNTIHRSNSTLTPGITRRASFRRNADDSSIRRTTSSNRQLRIRKPGQGPRPRGDTGGSTVSAAAAADDEDLLAGVSLSSQADALPTIHSPRPSKQGTDLDRIFAASPQAKGLSGGAARQQEILDDLFG